MNRYFLSVLDCSYFRVLVVYNLITVTDSDVVKAKISRPRPHPSRPRPGPSRPRPLSIRLPQKLRYAVCLTAYR